MSFITTYTLWLCTAKPHALHCSWCAVHLYSWYEATQWNTKVCNFSNHAIQQKMWTKHSTQKFLPFQKWNPSYPDQCQAPYKLQHYTHQDQKTNYNAHPFIACISGLAPLCNSSSTMSLSPLSTASCRAVAPHKFIAFTSAPRSETQQAQNIHI
jgi:hypothetical protein